MATIAISFGSACAGGGHLALNVVVNGGAAQSIPYTIDEIRDAQPSELVHDLVLGLLRLHCAGMTRAQVRTALQSGFTVVD